MSTESDLPMSGNGDKNCPKCHGRGVIPIPIREMSWGGTQNCECVFQRDLLANVKRVWQVLLSVESVPHSPLLAKTKNSLWITASNYTLRRHLRHVAFRMGTKWDARVIADATLITAWLSTAKNVVDPDVLVERETNRARPSDDFLTLVDIAVPFDLLIIRLGVKAAKNKEMSNVLMEAINEREILGLPTWIVDSPNKPLGPGHICFSEGLIDMLEGFERIILQEEAGAAAHGAAAPYQPRIPQGVTPIQGTAGGVAAPTSQPQPQTPQAVYTRKKSSMYGPPPVLSEPKKVAPVRPLDEGEFSVDQLMEQAVALMPVNVAETPDIEFDLEEVLGDYPLPDDLKTNGTPKFLKGKKQ